MAFIDPDDIITKARIKYLKSGALSTIPVAVFKDNLSVS